MNGQIINGIPHVTVPLSWLADVMHRAFGDAQMTRLWGGAPWLVKFDDGKGSHPHGYSMPEDRTDERQQVIINQVRYAATKDELQQALDAAGMYEPVLYDDLRSVYDWRMRELPA